MMLSARSQTLSDILRRTARRLPKKVAIRCGNTSWTYAKFDAVCSSLASSLLGLGVNPGDRIAVLSRNSHSFAALRFAVARVGAVLVPVNFMLRAEEIAFILRHSGASVLCVDSEFSTKGRLAAELETQIRHFIWMPSEHVTIPPSDMHNFQSLVECSLADSQIQVPSNSLAQIIYTSGTESQPKGAMLSHEAVLWEYVTCLVDAEITQADLILHALPLYHCAQLDVFLGPAVFVGATNVITSRPEPHLLLDLFERNSVTSFFAPPTVWISLLRSEEFNRTNLSSLRKGYYGASIMPVEVLRELQKRLPIVRFWNLYGQTEIAPVATVLGPEDQLRKPGSAGLPALNVETRVVDENMNDVEIGQVGEVVHRSPQLMLGYYRDEERTTQAFEGGWFHSGDLAIVDDDGYLTIVDRKKDMIKSGGENVSSREVEEVLYKLPQISEAAVIATPDDRWIEAVTAVVVVRKGSLLTEEEVITHCLTLLASFKAPKRVEFVEALPKNPSGKVLKRELRDLLKNQKYSS
jgi:fatty-acyl-CoA synthase